MKPTSFMLIAGESSGDLLAAELVRALRMELAASAATPTTDFQPLHTSLAPRFFGAGGPHMQAAGVDLAFDLTRHSVIGLSEVLKNLLRFRRLFGQLVRIAIERQPDAIICVDFSYFNRRFAEAIRRYARVRQDWFHGWRPKVIKYVSPQIWASRAGRVFQVARDHDLLLTIFPFEPAWYARLVPQLRVEFVGHPLVDRYSGLGKLPATAPGHSAAPMLLLLPGSRPGELARHLPVMFGALPAIRAAMPDLRVRMVLPDETLVQQALTFSPPDEVEIRSGGLPQALLAADVAMASTGTVTMECAYFGVPTVALYKTSLITYEIAKRIVTVRYLAMPNLLAGEELFPEFIQGAASPANLARATLELFRDDARRRRIKTRLAELVSTLGRPGASTRAAKAIVRVLNND